MCISSVPSVFVLFEIPNMYAIYVIIYVLKIGKRFFRMFENWFLECDEDMQTTGLHATGCIITFKKIFFKFSKLKKKLC